MQKIYSDGSVENKILDYLKENHNKCEKIVEDIPDGAVFHNFTRIRENILNWYPFKADADVLEVGAGMGALTGMLCAMCRNVTALEPSCIRAGIIKERYSHLENLEVIIQDITKYKPRQKFDYITLIGVLEYAGIHADKAKPHARLLKKIREMLKPDGLLLLAIENKYGLKYWAGAAEDHTGVPFAGINNYEKSESERYHAGGIRTFGKKELQDMLSDAGFEDCRFYYPMPDYKFPSAIFTDEYLPDEEDIRSVKFLYPVESELVADERKVYPEIIKNGQFSFFADSFLIEAGGRDFIERDLLYVKLKRDYKPQYQMATLIHTHGVVKKGITQMALGHLDEAAGITEQLEKRGVSVISMKKRDDTYAMEYHKGRQADGVICDLFQKDDGDGVIHLLEVLEKNLKKSSEASDQLGIILEGLDFRPEDSRWILSQGYIDMTFVNSFYCEDELTFFDQEWCVDGIPIEYILFRALLHAYPEGRTHLQISQVFTRIGITPKMRRVFEILENRILDGMMDKQSCSWLDPLMYREELAVVPAARKKIHELERKVKLVQQAERDQAAKIQKELDEMRASRTWRMACMFQKMISAIAPTGSYRRIVSQKVICAAVYAGEYSNRVWQKKKLVKNYGRLVFSKAADPDVTIIIPVYNQFHYTYDCLKAVWKNTGDAVKYEVIVADDCSDDETKKLDQLAENIKIISNKSNLGFLKNCNHAAKSAGGKYLLFLNNDTQVQSGWLDALVELMEKYEDIGIAGSKLVYEDGTLQEAGGIVWRDASAWNYGNGQDAGLPEYNYVKDVDYVSGASLLIRRELWDDIGGFDERYTPAYCEDSDLAFEARKRGYRVVYQPKSVVKHLEGISNGRNVHTGIKKYQEENRRKLAGKWKAELSHYPPNGQAVFRARERSYKKRIILFIGSCIPQYGKDADSKIVYRYIKMFIRQGYLVKFLAGDFRRREPYTSHLQQMGVEVLYGSYYKEHELEWIAKNRTEIDFVIVNHPARAAHYMDCFYGRSGARIIYWYGMQNKLCREEAELVSDGQKIHRNMEWKKKELDSMKKSNIVYCFSNKEAEVLNRMDKKLHVKLILSCSEHFNVDEAWKAVSEDFADK